MKRISILLMPATITGVLLLSAPPSAATEPGFGRHVSECARTMGFSGTHNPGMHRGAQGWDGMVCMP